MSRRFIAFLVIVGLVVIFAGMNIRNSSGISFGFWKAEEVPIFVSLFFAYVVGIITMVPFVVGKRSSRKLSKPDGAEEPRFEEELPAPDG